MKTRNWIVFFVYLSPLIFYQFSGFKIDDLSLMGILTGGTSFLCIFSLTQSNRRLALLVLLPLVFISFLFNALYFKITRTPLNTLEFIRLMQERGFVGSFLKFYFQEILMATLLASLIVSVLFLLSRWKKQSHWSLKKISLIWTMAILINVTWFIRSQGSVSGLQLWPASLPSHIIAYYFDRMILHSSPDLPREDVRVKPIVDGIENIVLIIDESIRGDIIDVNSQEGVQSALKLEDPRVSNFGLASSFSNCSAASNESFHFLVRQKHFVEDRWTHPSLWQFAKAAGYESIYIDSQRTKGEPHAEMSVLEKKHIDILLLPSADEVSVVQRDAWASKKLIEFLHKPGKHFIYVNKMGAHFPYEGKYPESAALYLPHLKENNSGITESQSYGNNFGSIEFKNSYRNAVSWNLTQFFVPILQQNLANTLIFYTSDHGQNLDRSIDGRQLTHCTYRDAPRAEGIVPLLTLTGDSSWQHNLQLAAKAHFNQATHFNVPPTLLLAMGYPEQKTMDATIFEKKLYEQMFSSGYFLSFGAHPIWRQICVSCGNERLAQDY